MNSKVTVKVPKRSGFDKSHQNILTTKCGTLTPILVDELIPNSHVNLTAAISACLPPLASDTFMRCDLKLEAFFVPHRILYGGYEKWLTGDKIYDAEALAETDVWLPKVFPFTNDTTDEEFNTELTAPGTLFDYLGGKFTTYSGPADATVGTLNAFPFLAYYKIYDDWYRNTQVQKPLFFPSATTYGTAVIGVSNLPYTTITEYTDIDSARIRLGDKFGVSGEYEFGQLMQRNFGLDYFTIATPNAQLGDAKKVTFSTSGVLGNFTIASLRAANSLQQFAERNALGGLRMQDYVKNNYGADLASGVAQRALYLGSASINVYSKGVYSNTSNAVDTDLGTQNPFAGTVGAEFGSASCAGEANLVKDFTAAEPGTLMVLASLVPRVTYSTGLSRMMTRYQVGDAGSITDLANPLLQNVGNQPIFEYELNAGSYFNTNYNNSVFGYTDRYADWKYMPDELHGLVRDGENLKAFALQRTVTGHPRINSTFLRIPTDYLDQVAAVDGEISAYGCWIDSFFKYYVSMPLSEYSIPSLQDPAYEHGVDVDIDVRGSKL